MKYFLLILGLAIAIIVPTVVHKYYNSDNSAVMDDATEINIVSEYIKSHINDLALEKPILGGTWYITDVQVDPVNNSGSATYEDGHIQGRIVFKYNIDSKTNNISITDVREE